MVKGLGVPSCLHNNLMKQHSRHKSTVLIQWSQSTSSTWQSLDAPCSQPSHVSRHCGPTCYVDYYSTYGTVAAARLNKQHSGLDDRAISWIGNSWLIGRQLFEETPQDVHKDTCTMSVSEMSTLVNSRSRMGQSSSADRRPLLPDDVNDTESESDLADQVQDGDSGPGLGLGLGAGPGGGDRSPLQVQPHVHIEPGPRQHDKDTMFHLLTHFSGSHRRVPLWIRHWGHIWCAYIVEPTISPRFSVAGTCCQCHDWSCCSICPCQCCHEHILWSPDYNSDCELCFLCRVCGTRHLQQPRDASQTQWSMYLVGIGTGLSSMTVPVYIAESAPFHLRGRLVTLNNVFITGGQFTASVIDGAFSYDQQNGWRSYKFMIISK